MAPAVSTIFDMLPKTDCRQCAHASCCSFATALAEGDAPVSGCPALAEEQRATIARIISEHRAETAALTLEQPTVAKKEEAGVFPPVARVLLLPFQALWLLIFTFPLSVPAWFFLFWLMWE